ncbi:MAG: ABC transporter permease [Desulfobacteraceae bacterium]
MNRVELAAITLRFRHVWMRNLVTYRRIWRINFLVPLLEPAFYILAFGLGFSGLIGGVDYAGRHMAYIQFMAPALVATACMWNAFFETTYASFVRMYYQNTFDGILATPVSLEEMIIAEIVWAASKAAAAVTVMLTVLIPLGYAAFPGALMCIPLAFGAGLAFGAIGMFFTGYHLVELTRFFCIGAMESNPVFNLIYLVVFTVVFGYLGLWAMKRRLIK